MTKFGAPSTFKVTFSSRVVTEMTVSTVHMVHMATVSKFLGKEEKTS